MADSSSRWNIFAGFMAGLVLGVFGTGLAMSAYLTHTEIKPRQKQIDELNVKVIELEGERDRWRTDYFRATIR